MSSFQWPVFLIVDSKLFRSLLSQIFFVFELFSDFAFINVPGLLVFKILLGVLQKITQLPKTLILKERLTWNLSLKFWGNGLILWFILSDYRMYSPVLEYFNSKRNNRIILDS